MEGDMTGSIFLIMPFHQAEQFIRELIGNPDFDIDQLGEDHLSSSALHEFGNILAGSYLTALADLTKLEIYPSVPEISLDMFGAVISEGLMELSQVGEHAIVVDTSIFDQGAGRSSKLTCLCSRTMILLKSSSSHWVRLYEPCGSRSR